MRRADNDKGEKLEISCITGGNTNGTLLWGKKKFPISYKHYMAL